jgi:hypothetical protein
MAIYKAALTSNFTQIDNAIITSTMPPVAFKIYSYLISKPETWQPKAHDIKKQLGLSAYATKKALRWLCSAGYAAWVRLKTGHTIWHIFSNPKVVSSTIFANPNRNPELSLAQPETVYSPVIPPQFENSQVDNQPVLVISETEEINKPLPAPEPEPEPPLPLPTPIPPIPEPESVVVSSELIYPVQLNPVQKKAARAVIKKVSQPEIQQEVLFALAYAIASGTVKSPVAYLNGLVTRANNGTFEPVTATTASKQGGKPLIPIWQGFGQSSPSKPETATGFIQQARAALRGAKC